MLSNSRTNCYAANAKWLALLAPFRGLTLSAAYITPFFLDKGLSLWQIFLLQSVFSLFCVLFEIPSGWLADHMGRARAVAWSMPIAGLAMLTYGLRDEYLVFMGCEIVMAAALALNSGADYALLYDSVRADASLNKSEVERRVIAKWRQVKSAGFMSFLPATPAAMLLVHYAGLSATVIGDSVLMLVGWLIARQLVEAPHHVPIDTPEADLIKPSAWHDSQVLLRNVEVRWLVWLGTVLGMATYLGFWISAPYYQLIGIPLAWFAVILALRNAFKSLLAYRYGGEHSLDSHWSRRWLRRRFLRCNVPESWTMWSYVGMAGGTFAAMATGIGWLFPAVIGHDVVHALHEEHIRTRLNQTMASSFRATLNSVVNLVNRLVYAIAGPIVGWLADSRGLPTAMLYTGVACSTLAAIALLRLQRLGTFRPQTPV